MSPRPRKPESGWELAEATGRVLYDKGTGRHYVQVFCLWPGAKKSKRHRIYADTESEARKILRRIQARIAHGAQLYVVLTDYVADRSRNVFLKRWQAFCLEKEQDARA